MTKGRGGLRGGHVLAIFLGFFITVVAVDGLMIYQAVSTFGGLETQDAYRKGLAYNQRIAQDAEQSLAGWRDEVKVVGSPHRLHVALRDQSAAAIAGKRLIATVGRPATERFDMTLELVEISPGIYEAALPAASEGSWIVDLSAYDANASGSPLYQARRRAWIGP